MKFDSQGRLVAPAGGSQPYTGPIEIEGDEDLDEATE
jgi:hypothetical protein